eukprot:1838136-Amphidinium_carterae.1
MNKTNKNTKKNWRKLTKLIKQILRKLEKTNNGLGVWGIDPVMNRGGMVDKNQKQTQNLRGGEEAHIVSSLMNPGTPQNPPRRK